MLKNTICDHHAYFHLFCITLDRQSLALTLGYALQFTSICLCCGTENNIPAEVELKNQSAESPNNLTSPGTHSSSAEKSFQLFTHNSFTGWFPDYSGTPSTQHEKQLHQDQQEKFWKASCNLTNVKCRSAECTAWMSANFSHPGPKNALQKHCPTLCSLGSWSFFFKKVPPGWNILVH